MAMGKKNRAKKIRGLKIDFISAQAFVGMTLDKKLAHILKKVKEDHIVVLNESLDFMEEAKLVTSTMEGIDENLKGIEFFTLPRKGNSAIEFVAKSFEKVTGKQMARAGLTLVGPASIIKKIKRDPQAFSVSAEI